MGKVAVYMYCAPVIVHDSGGEYKLSAVTHNILHSFSWVSVNKGSSTDNDTSNSGYKINHKHFKYNINLFSVFL